MRLNVLLFILLLFTEVISAQESKDQEGFKFSNESEVSIIETGGNSNVETYNGKTLSRFEGKKSIYKISGHYIVSFFETEDENGETIKAESARNWDIMGKYERKFTKRINGFTALQYEGDVFSGFKQRENIDLGGKYLFLDTDKVKTSFEIGARYTVEKRVERNKDGKDKFKFAKGRIYLEHDQVYSEQLSFKLWFEYIPNFTEGEDYLINYEPSITVVLSNLFSLKTAYRVNYDNLPNIEGNNRTDYVYTTSLLTKF